jgi:hypothetical protein
LGLGLAFVGFRYVQSQIALEREERAIILVTTSELVPLRLVPATAEVPAGAHANYRGRAGNDIAVLTAEALPSAPAGRTYQAWVRHGQRWTPIGPLMLGPDGSAHLITQNSRLANTPDLVEITLESSGATPDTPAGPVILAWPTPAAP